MTAIEQARERVRAARFTRDEAARRYSEMLCNASGSADYAMIEHSRVFVIDGLQRTLEHAERMLYGLLDSEAA